MRTVALCSVPDCNKKIDCNGYCAAHERRWKRHGDPLGGTTSRNAARRHLQDVVIPYTGNDCLRWPFGNNGRGYGVYHVNRKAVGVHVVVCGAVHGPAPTPEHEAAHSCGNGHLLCCTPRHLRWATSKENHADKKLHGTDGSGEKNGASKLQAQDVQKIRSLIGLEPQWKIAEQFGVCQMSISHIATGRSWGWLK